MTPTQQQQACMDFAGKEAILKIIASAGAGKTSTLNLCAEANKVPSIYYAFNKVTAVEAARKFPDWVECRTQHSFAYGKFGVDLQHKLSRPKGGYVNVGGTGSEIAKLFKVKGIDNVITAAGIGLLIKRTVERFEQSADDYLSDTHVPVHEMPESIRSDSEFNRFIRDTAIKLWKKRISEDSTVLASHDTYLKLFQLSKPKLNAEIIYADEWQDATPCVLDILMNQTGHAKIVAVGDPFQAIYQWRGSINALENLDGKTLPLTKSFRFGQAVADVANKILMHKVRVEGLESIDSVVGENIVDTTKPYMYLFRTNSQLLIEAVNAVDRGVPVVIEIDTRDFVKLLTSAQALSENKPKEVKHERIVPYTDWDNLVEESKTDGELKRIVQIIKDGRARYMIRVLESYSPADNPLITFTTAHKSKGREHDQVILADDFPSHYGKDGWTGLKEAEQNLLYVAATRAINKLEINESIKEIFHMSEEQLKHLDNSKNSVALKNIFNRQLQKEINSWGVPWDEGAF